MADVPLVYSWPSCRPVQVQAVAASHLINNKSSSQASTDTNWRLVQARGETDTLAGVDEQLSDQQLQGWLQSLICECFCCWPSA
jgi:hypothetical protein